MRAAALSVAARVRHRGPDDRGWMQFDGRRTPIGPDTAKDSGSCHLLLGHTRLSIIDLSPDGHQPMSTEDGRFTITYNGEIYNYLELRRELEGCGIGFSTRSDTEVLLRAYAHWGLSCLLRLVGMFAFAIYDREADEVVLARDFFGIKPLFYQAGANGITFASEIEAILDFPGTDRRVNRTRAIAFLDHGEVDAGSDTMVLGIHQVPPAHFVRASVAKGQLAQARQYWAPAAETRWRWGFDEAKAELRRLLLESLRIHLRSDVPLGVALSGGIDSASIACGIRAVAPGIDLKTFSFVARGSSDSEEAWVDLANQAAGASAHKTISTGDELAEDVDRLIRRLGEPFASTSIYAQDRVFRLAARHGIKVMLEGQGADELFAGYGGYVPQRLHTLLLRGRWLQAASLLRRASAWPGRSTRGILRGLAADAAPRLYRAARSRLRGSDGWLRREAGQAVSDRAQTRLRVRGTDKVKEELAHSLVVSGLPTLLRHGDRNAMTYSIENRVPFLTREIAEFSLALPEQYLVDGDGRSKSVLREAMRGIAPDEILDRRDKIGFVTPQRDWLRQARGWVDQVIASAADSEIVDGAVVRGSWESSLRGAALSHAKLWRYLNYVRWTRLLSISES